MVSSDMFPRTVWIHTDCSDGLPDCAPGKCPATAEISPVQCSSDPAMFFNNGYPTLCGEGTECDTAAAEAGEGNPCRAVEAAEEGYEK